MTDAIQRRRETLDALVALKTRHTELAELQYARIDAVTLSSVPSVEGVELERVVLAEEKAVVSEFTELAVEFPGSGLAPVRPAPPNRPATGSGLLGWLPAAKRPAPPPLAVSAADEIAGREAAVQDARLLHLLVSFGEALAERRTGLQHASYQLKRVAVGLNQSAAFLPDDTSAKPIERERHRLETVVSTFDAAITELVLAARSLSLLAEARTPPPEPEKPAPEEIFDDDPRYLIAGPSGGAAAG